MKPFLIGSVLFLAMLAASCSDPVMGANPSLDAATVSRAIPAGAKRIQYLAGSNKVFRLFTEANKWSAETLYYPQGGYPSLGCTRIFSKSGDYHSGTKSMVGNFDGALGDEIVLWWPENNQWSADVYRQVDGAYIRQSWARDQGAYWSGQQYLSGDFNGDGRLDVLKWWNDYAGWSADVHLSNGSGFEMQRWATRQGNYWDGQHYLTGDFNGDGKTDIAKWWNDDMGWTIDVHLSTGSSFEMQRWATRQGNYWDGQQYLTGDFNGDGKTDFMKYWNDGNGWTADVHLSNGSSFELQRWATKLPTDYWEKSGQPLVVYDDDHDGRDDLMDMSSGEAFAVRGNAFQRVAVGPNIPVDKNWRFLGIGRFYPYDARQVPAYLGPNNQMDFYVSVGGGGMNLCYDLATLNRVK